MNLPTRADIQQGFNKPLKPRNHVLYKDGDIDIPAYILKHRKVALACCRACGKEDIELQITPHCQPSKVWYASDSTMMDENGNRSVFDDVDE